MIRSRVRDVVSLWCLLLAVAGCSAAARPAARSAPAASLPSELRVGQSGDYPPFSELRDETFQGFSAELSRRYAAARGLRLQFVRFDWPSLMPDLAANRFVVADSGITVRPERSIAARYTVPIARTGSVLLLRRPAWARSTPSSEASAAGDAQATLKALDRPEFRLAVNRGGHLERVARAQFHNAQIVAIPGNEGVRIALADASVDAALTNTLEAPRWAQGVSGLETIGPFTRDWVALIVREDHGGLARDLDAWLLEQEQAGMLDALRARYFGFNGSDHATATPLRALLAATAERLALMPAVGAAKRRAGLPIEDRAQEAAVLSAAVEEVARVATAEQRPKATEGAVRAFFEAQIEAAKQLQQPIHATAATQYSLAGELRPAIARISQRMAWLLARLPEGLARAHVQRWVHDDLQGAGLLPEQLDRLADALVRVSKDIRVAPKAP